MILPPDLGPGASRVLDRLSKAIRELADESGLEIRLGDAAGGEPFLVDADTSAATGAIAALLDAYGFVLDAERTRRRADLRSEQLQHDARTDPLTGLLNRRGWDEAVMREQARCARSPRPVAVVVVDLDHLKRTNDTFGHLAGDMLLRLAAGILRDAVRTSDVVARIGGDEFALLLLDHTDDDVETIIARIEAVLAAECVDAAVGGALRATDGTLEDLVATADRAMYVRKRAHHA